MIDHVSDDGMNLRALHWNALSETVVHSGKRDKVYSRGVFQTHAWPNAKKCHTWPTEHPHRSQDFR
jgi:hypothetical protein